MHLTRRKIGYLASLKKLLALSRTDQTSDILFLSPEHHSQAVKPCWALVLVRKAEKKPSYSFEKSNNKKAAIMMVKPPY